MQTAGLFDDARGRPSATRVGFLLIHLVAFIGWMSTCLNEGRLVDLDPKLLALLLAVTVGKVGVNVYEVIQSGRRK